ncbi:reductive dehalogenase [Thermodesulfobacteriota bacterium]
MKGKSGGILCLLLFVILTLGFYDLAQAADDVGRIFLKTGAFLASILGIIGISIAGYIAGKDYDSYTGWERFTHGAGQFFNRKPFQKEKPTYEKTDQHSRLHYIDNLQARMENMMMLTMPPPGGGKPKWAPPMGMDALPEPLRSFYKSDNEAYTNMLKAMQLAKKQQEDWPKWETQFAIADYWSKAMGSLFKGGKGKVTNTYPQDPEGPPEEWDFRFIHRKEPMRFKSPAHASKLIKKITHTFGATLVGITKLNPDWVFQGRLRGVGNTDYEVPDHWEYAIVFATPHEWDMFYANAVYGTSFDAYSRERIIGARLENFLQQLGYPARAHVPPGHYDLITPPIAIDAGLGEQGRHGLLITPELGANARLAVVTTNIPMEVDKPIDIGVKNFCKKCKICAEKCVTGAISHAEEPDIEFGYKRWSINCELCFQVWCSMATSEPGRGCRVCLAVCPYSRKNNWIHSLSRQIDPRDPTGIVSTMLLWMQKAFFKYPGARDFMPPPEGKNATYHRPPDWLITEEWFDVEKTW